MAPTLMRAYKLNRDQAIELLLTLTPDERHAFYKIRGRALVFFRKPKA